ncbi:Uncharacterised protein [BD1-7 clade bacterium]|uniref:Uncharacterized protein n=1 Tax=BD1-7 clade bacterium TaxID=2029982 RepID=A0A5S9Q656_9GAMM|nr:Uncharacterised protein [BD1-7 clade bacterium]
MKQHASAVIVVLVIVVLGWGVRSMGPSDNDVPVASTEITPSPVNHRSAVVERFPLPRVPSMSLPERSPIHKRKGVVKPTPKTPVTVVLDETAIASLRDTRVHGDKRAPEVVRPVPRIKPPADVIGNESRYQAYEAAQEHVFKNAYRSAADTKIETLESLIQQARSAGVDSEALDIGAKKLEAIRMIQKRLEADRSVE